MASNQDLLISSLSARPNQIPSLASSAVSLSRRRSSTKENGKSRTSAPTTPDREARESLRPDSEQYALQETLRALAPEMPENEIYWLPVAVAKLGMKTANIPRVGLDVQQRIGEDGTSSGKVDSRRAVLGSWQHAARTEEKLYDLQLKQRGDGPRLFDNDVDAVDGVLGENEEDDEDLQELLDELKVSGYNRNFRRAKERRSKRYTSALEQEIAERNEHLKQRMDQINARAKRFEKGFEALDTLAVKMDTLAESSKLRVQFLEQCLIPLYNESARHQICRTNAERAIEAIDAALHHYKVPEQMTAVIQAGPVKNLPAYCAALEKVKASVDFFSDFHTNTPEYDQVSTLYRIGRDNLIKEFRDMLRMHSKPVPEQSIHDAIVGALRDPSFSHDMAHFSETAHNDLKMVSQWFLKTNDKFDFMEVYAEFRADTMKASLEQFKTYYKERAGGLMGGAADLDADRKSVNVSMAASGHSGETMSRMGEDDTRSVSLAADDRAGTLKRRTAKSTPRSKGGAHSGGTATLFQKFRRLKKPGAASKTAGMRVGIDDETYQQVEVYMAMVSAFLKLVESEVSLMYGIIPLEHMRDVFDRIVRPSMEKFDKLGKELAAKILHHVQTGDFSAVLLLLQILEHFQSLQTLFDAALEGCTQQTQHNWLNVQLVFRTAVNRTMDGFLASIKQSNDRVLPADGTVHELTSNTIAFLSNLVDYRPLFDALIAEESVKVERKVSSANTGGGGGGGGGGGFYLKQGAAQASSNFPQYLNSVVTHLLANLTTRAENYSDSTLKAIFLLNNTSYMFNCLKSNILDVMKEDNGDIDKLITARIGDQKKAYMECWTTLSRLLTEAIGDAGVLRGQAGGDLSMKHSTSIDYSVQLKEKDRQAMKDRCTAINKELQQQASKQERYSVPDPPLRLALQQQNRSNILSLYETFRERYMHIPFTKFHDKYLPFTTSQVSDMLERFFSQDTFSAALHGANQTFRVDD